MNNQSVKNQNLILNFSYYIFVFSIVYLIGSAIGLKTGLFMQLLLILLISTLIKYFVFNPLIFYLSLSASFLIALLVNHYITPFIFSFMDLTYKLFLNIINNLKGKEMILEDYRLIYWIIIVLLFSLYTSVILFKVKKIYLLVPVYFSFYLYYWYYFYNEAFWMLSLFILFYLILMGIDKYNKEIAKSSSKKDFEKLYFPWLNTTVSYAIFIILISLVLPKSSNYIKWNWLQNKVYTAFPVVTELRSSNIYSREYGGASLFDFSTTGFQVSSSKLGGPVELSNKKIMTLQASDKTYLRGNIKHKYTGYSWESVDVGKENYKLKQDFSGITNEEKEIFFKETDITITNHSFATTTLFSPYMPMFVNAVDESWISVNKDYSIILGRGIYDNESYFVRTQKPLPYGMLVAYGIDKKKDDIEDLDLYLQIPDNITERTKSLVKEIVKGKDTDYEKAKAIELFLRNNFKYNLRVSEVPEGNEFVDYFLFEEEEGYCTYFATSMAILLRLENIPTRYIEGFLAYNMVEQGKYEVLQENAHAWVEAFIEPVGWMTFEATPQYPIEDRMEDFQLATLNEEESVANENIANLQQRRNINDPDMEDELEIGIGDWNLGSENQSYDVKTISKNTFLIIFGILLSIVPIKFIVGFIKSRAMYRRMKKLPINKRIIVIYDQITKLIAALGYPQLSGETHYEYAQRIAYKFYDYDKIGIKDITDIFVKYKYSNKLASDEEMLILEDYMLNLDKRLKNHIGRRKYYLSKYFHRSWIR